ncbi:MULTISPECIES: SGNH/GDSL hydrolase family protein [Dyella]|uniref:SGNH/GDSL hydrolase family protein n=2 Tax=Dyella TaxID=231454 RepID=A0A4V2NLF0_9GAMM|nr:MULTISPECIES: SGNH/GDSL hydrolase family protein [Dyella]TBR35848.1 hypothetical protein EYV96_17805 [Dyella terrae]TCI08604.1 hypothetical protein EZM97_28750 [Dyella soli]
MPTRFALILALLASTFPALAHQASSTHTYARCWYRLPSPALTPKTSFEWARDPQGHWLEIPGRWWSDHPLAWRNMFYTPTSAATLRAHCERTLAAKGIDTAWIDVHAADNALSFNYTFWSEAATPGHRLDRLIVFGDSLSDTSNLFNASQWRFPNASSWLLGRFSNGPVWPEYLAESTRLPLYNWAIAGAAAEPYIVVPGLMEQVASWAQYMDRAQGYDPSRTLFLVWIGANDIINYERPVADIARIVESAVERIIDRGGRHIAVINLPDLARVPSMHGNARQGDVARDTQRYNRLLQEAVAGIRAVTGIDVALVDAHGMFNALLASPRDYGLENVTQSCLNINTDTFRNYLASWHPRTTCHDAHRFLFWDLTHPTTHAHRIIAEKVRAVLRKRFSHAWPHADTP